MQTAVKKFNQRGFTIIGDVLDEREVATAARAVDRLKIGGAGTRSSSITRGVARLCSV